MPLERASRVEVSQVGSKDMGWKGLPLNSRTISDDEHPVEGTVFVNPGGEGKDSGSKPGGVNGDGTEWVAEDFSEQRHPGRFSSAVPIALAAVCET